MAKSGILNITFYDNPGSFNALDILRWFQSHGWKLDNEGKICYLSLEDGGSEWVSASSSNLDEMHSILSKKVERGEIVGVLLTPEMTVDGVRVLLYPDLKKITLDAGTHRKTVDGLDIIDFTWYLEQILPVLSKAGLSIEGVDCIDA